MAKRFQHIGLLGIVWLCLLTLAACGGGAQPITGADREAVIAYAEPQTDNLLQGYNAGDYAIFSRDFDAAMRTAETETVFTQTRTQLQSKLGAYVSREIKEVTMVEGFVVVLYNAKFEQADDVTVRLVFEPQGAHPISGLWFNSPKLN